MAQKHVRVLSHNTDMCGCMRWCTCLPFVQVSCFLSALASRVPLMLMDELHFAFLRILEPVSSSSRMRMCTSQPSARKASHNMNAHVVPCSLQTIYDALNDPRKPLERSAIDWSLLDPTNWPPFFVDLMQKYHSLIKNEYPDEHHASISMVCVCSRLRARVFGVYVCMCMFGCVRMRAMDLLLHF